jgi:hypothetical protein
VPKLVINPWWNQPLPFGVGHVYVYQGLDPPGQGALASAIWKN